MPLNADDLRDVLNTEMEARQAAKEQSQPRETKLAFFIVDKVALAMQQAEFLQRTCPGRIGLLYGALGVDNFSEAQWADVYEENDVVVLTADILKSAFARGFLHIERANLLVYDEAHHCQASHAYALIQQEFYHKTHPSKRPKIFGMTASPVSQSRNRPQSVVEELERRLNAKICTPDPSAGLSDYVIRPNEIEVFYAKPESKAGQVPILDEMEILLSPVKYMKKLLSNARYAEESLGPWACIDILRDLCQEQQWRIEAKATTSQTGHRNYETDTVKLAKAKILDWPRPTSLSVFQSITPKGDLLLQLLKKIYETALDTGGEDPVTIVFCERRSTAKLLMIAVTDYVKTSMPKNLRASLFIGHGGTNDGDYSMALQTQALVVEQFRKNKFKYAVHDRVARTTLILSSCLFATSVAEEGIDIPACNYGNIIPHVEDKLLTIVVIKFDSSNNCIRYIQSRGRARKSGSSYITMLEEGDAAAMAHHQCIKEAESIIRSLCETLPDDRIVSVEYQDELSSDQPGDRALPSFEAISVVEMYCRSLPADDFVSHKPVYDINVTGMGFMATCLVPAVAGIPIARGSVQKSKAFILHIFPMFELTRNRQESCKSRRRTQCCKRP